jgi:hypothetical protein
MTTTSFTSAHSILATVQFLAAAVVLLAAYGTGVAGSRALRLPLPAGLRGRATAFTVGFMVLSTLAFALGRTGAFTRWTLGTIAVVLAVPGAFVAARDARVLRALWRGGLEGWTIVAAGAITAFDAFLAGAPPTSADALQYHLAAPRLWLQVGRTFDIWWDQVTFQPLAVEMHYAYAQALWDGAAGAVVGAGLAGFSVVCVYGLARALCGPRCAALAALLWAAQGMFLWEATGAFTEIATAAFVALALWHVVELSRRGVLTDAAWAGLAMGAAASTKYFGALAAVGVLAAVVVAAPRARRLQAGGVFVLVGTVCLPWYVKNLIVAGNPLYPAFTGVFGGKYVGPSFAEYATVKSQQRGMPGLWRVVILPIEFIVHHQKFDRGYSISPAFFSLAPLAVVLWWRRRWVLAGGAALAIYTVLWYHVMFGIPRYLVPVLPLAAVLAAFSAVNLVERGGWWRRAALSVLAISAIPTAAMTVLFAARLVPGVVGTESTPHFVQRLTGTYNAFAWLDRNLPPEGRVLLGVRGAYWLHRPYATYDLPLFGSRDSTSTLVKRMRQYDVRYLALYEGEFPPPLRPLRNRLVRIATLAVPFVTSRALGTHTMKRLVVYRWKG